MAKYIWINPVAQNMYKDKIKEIEEHLINRGYILVSCEPQLEYVKKQYSDYAENIDKTILDCRCPESINLLKRNKLTDGFEVPEIEPILVRTSRVLYKKYVKEENDILIITCPCTQLRDYGKSRRNMDNVIFLTWKEFIESEGEASLGKIDKSPIPLGYFRDAFENVLEISGEEEIINSIKEVKASSLKKHEIIEMLYCREGCNNGDGL